MVEREMNRRKFLQTGLTLALLPFISCKNIPEHQKIIIGDSMAYFSNLGYFKIAKSGMPIKYIENMCLDYANCEGLGYKNKGKIISPKILIWVGTADSVYFQGSKYENLLEPSLLGLNKMPERGEKAKQLKEDFEYLMNSLNNNYKIKNLRILSPFPISSADNEDIVDDFNNWIQANYSGYIDIRNYFFKNGKLVDEYNSDDVHINKRGYKKIGEILK